MKELTFGNTFPDVFGGPNATWTVLQLPRPIRGADISDLISRYGESSLKIEFKNCSYGDSGVSSKFLDIKLPNYSPEIEVSIWDIIHLILMNPIQRGELRYQLGSMFVGLSGYLELYKRYGELKFRENMPQDPKFESEFKPKFESLCRSIYQCLS